MTCYTCADRRRLLAVKAAGIANGIEFLEVRDHDEPVASLRQRTLLVHLLREVPAAIGPSWVVIDGGERIRRVAVDWAVPASSLPPGDAAVLLPGESDLERVLVVRTAARGDFSRYRFALVAPGTDEPPTGFDPLLAAVPFSFKVECPSDLDCTAPCTCPPGVHHPPPIDYLARDYDGFRRIMLERMALLVPGWTERAPADVGVTLVELLAYVADELSYRQDAVATEAFLNTARSRVSLRRHARLVDYHVHDGCNARVWAQLHLAEGTPTLELPAGTALLSRLPDFAPRILPGSPVHFDALAAGPAVFATVEPAVLDADLAELRFWTWGSENSRLCAGATTATVRGHHAALRPGDVLVLAETVAPGSLADADPETTGAPPDPSHRYAVRLVEVTPATDPAGDLFEDGTTDVTELRWHDEDALPDALCLVVDGTETAVAWGNIVLADHGLSVTEPLGTVPPPHLSRVGPGCDDEPVPVPARFRPTLGRRPLTRAVAAVPEVVTGAPLTPALVAELDAGAVGDALQAVFASIGVVVPDGAPVGGGGSRYGVCAAGSAWPLRREDGLLEVLTPAGSATAAVAPAPADARPVITLTGVEPAGPFEWGAAADLISRTGTERVFVVETESDGTALLRFGDDRNAARPVTGTTFVATYRVGNGVAGNIGREVLAHVVTGDAGIAGVDNPLPASGGVEPETSDEIRRDAPATLAVQERAVTAADYELLALRTPSTAKAAASFRWTGSWHTVFVTADRSGGAAVDAPFEASLRAGLERYRMAGYDLEVDGPRFVPLEVGLRICVAAHHRRADVAAGVREVLSNRVLADGTLGQFHPDRYTFGQPVYLSALLAAVHAVTGVDSVDVLTFERQHEPASAGIDTGVLPMGRLEVARLDNDPNFPERGLLDLMFGGGT